MDLVSIFPIIGLIVDGAMIILIANQYFRTRYRPSLILLLQYIAFISIHFLWLPISFLGAEQLEPANYLMLGIIFIVLLFPSFTIAFFESTGTHPFGKLLITSVLYYTFLIGYAFTINWVFVFDRIWRYQMSEIVLILFIIPFAAVVVYIFTRLLQILTSKTRNAGLKMQWGFGKRAKILLLIWTGGLLFRYLSILLLARDGVSEFSIVILILSVFTIALVFLYDPSAFFLSNARIQSFLIFDAQSGKLLYSMGGAEDDLKASGLYGASTLEREISGASSLPHLLVFFDRVLLIEYQKVHDKLLAAAMIATKYNPVFLPSLSYGFHQFIKIFEKDIKNWNGSQLMFEKFTPKAMRIFNYAYSKDLTKNSQEKI